MRGDTDGSVATFSDDRRHRFWLERQLEPTGSLFAAAQVAVFVMLNPSTADAFQLDPTIRRCRAFAKREGASRLVVVNLFSLRSPDPSVLVECAEPSMPENERAIEQAARESGGRVICAWGAHPQVVERERDQEVLHILRAVGVATCCLGTTVSGQPRHPLYVRKDAPLVPWSPPR